MKVYLDRNFHKGLCLVMATEMETLLNYRNLVAKVDELCRRIIIDYGDLISCRKGCDGCCRHISIFPVEAFALATALSHSSAAESARIRNLARSASAQDCPLLDRGICLLYHARPIICRTHGFPILAGPEGEKALDFCPKNFTGVTSFQASAILDLDLLNATLAAINGVFIASRDENIWHTKERLSIAEALILDW
jgi:Fe-S-cluster containining protein